MVNSAIPTELRMLKVGESFRLQEKDQEKYDLLMKTKKLILVRSVEGGVLKMDGMKMVLREGNLSRGTDGNKESKVALTTFNFCQQVNFRNLRLNQTSSGYVVAFAGDGQCTPHPMSYSCLTIAFVNAVLTNKFVGQSLHGVAFTDRCAEYCRETACSNNEVITDGISSNYGHDGFLRLSSPCKDGIDFVYSKVLESMESGQDLHDILSPSWKD